MEIAVEQQESAVVFWRRRVVVAVPGFLAKRHVPKFAVLPFYPSGGFVPDQNR